jgi:hypothetical protein
MTQTKLLPLVLGSVLFVVTVACGLLPSRPAPKYGPEYNAERMRIGLPILPENWKLVYSGPDGARWLNPEADAKERARIPVHSEKSVDYDSGVLLSDGDSYYGSKDYTDIEGTHREFVGITYHYQIGKNDRPGQQLGWDAMRCDAEEPKCKYISLEEAEVILKAWGLQRLDYNVPITSP